MMKTHHPISCVLALLLALLLICFGGCGSSSTTADSGGIGGTGHTISVGSITAFGSVVVNGTEFDTSEAVIIVEGQEVGVGDEAVLDNLDIGRVVTVEGTGGEDPRSAVADRVTYNDDVEGPVESIDEIDPATKEIVVLGQTVILNVVTVFKATTFGTIAENDVVEVSGMVDETGAIWATFVEKTGEFMAPLDAEVTGFVRNLDRDLESFEINELTVDYSLIDPADLPEGFAEGLLVEVEGRLLDVPGGELVATGIVLGGVLESEEADAFEIMGFVTEFVSVFEFTVGYQQVVQTDEDTVFIDGTVDDIAPGVKLEAEGSLAAGILLAWEIEFWEPDQIEVEGVVTDYVSPWEYTVGDQVVQADEDTVYEGITPEDIALGVLLEVKGTLEDTILVADKVSFEEE
jgi:hypothetical protein